MAVFERLGPLLRCRLGGGGWAAYRYLQKEQIDTAFCYQRDDQHQVATFVDFSLTRNISPSQRRDLVNTLMQAFEAMPANGRLAGIAGQACFTADETFTHLVHGFAIAGFELVTDDGFTFHLIKPL